MEWRTRATSSIDGQVVCGGILCERRQPPRIALFPTRSGHDQSRFTEGDSVKRLRQVTKQVLSFATFGRIPLTANPSFSVSTG